MRTQAIGRHVLIGLATLLVSVALVPSEPATAGGGGHPFFNDGGTLRWYTSYAEALRVAKRENRLVFIESGRLRCSMCRRFCQTVLPDRSIRSRISAIAIGHAADCDDRSQRDVSQLFSRNLPNPRMLPLCAFVTPDGRWVTGFWGSRSASQFSRDLAVAERAWRDLQRQAAPATPSAPEPRRPAPRQEPRCVPPAPEPEPVPPPVADATDPEPDDGCDGNACDPDCCEGGCCDPNCHDGSCRPPSPVDDMLGPLDEPCRPDEAVIADAPEKPARDLSPNGFPAPRTPEAPPAVEPDLREPVVRAVPTPDALAERGMPAPPADTPFVATGDPDAIDQPAPPAPARSIDTDVARKATTEVRPASTSRSGARLKAEKAAARGQWGEVLRLTERHGSDRDLLALNRRAHAWAHDTLEGAVRLIESGDVDGARDQVDLVKREMDGRPEAEDARRGLDAIEYAKDLAYLSDDSLVRRAVSRNAYEKMRGSRWARLFR